MSDPEIKFSGLTTASPLDGTEIIAIVQGGASRKTTIDTGAQFKSDQNTRTTDGVTFATVDTGQGANELYPMNQAVRTTDDVTFGAIEATSISFDGGTNVLGDYDPAISFTPELSFVTVTYTAQEGSYFQIGNKIYAEIELDVSSLDNTDASSFTVVGFPSFAQFSRGIAHINLMSSTLLNPTAGDIIYPAFSDSVALNRLFLVDETGNNIPYNSTNSSAGNLFNSSGKLFITMEYLI